MPIEERVVLLQEVEQIREQIATLQPVVNGQQIELGTNVESIRAHLRALRRVLAKDMELLHSN